MDVIKQGTATSKGKTEHNLPQTFYEMDIEH